MDMQENTDVETAAGDNTALTFDEYNKILREISEQPAWRREADKAADYYDGKQLDSETLSVMRNMGMAPIIENLTAPTIDAVLGLEAKTRLDWKVTSQKDEENGDMAEAINQKLNEAEKETRADRANSDAFAAQVKSGLGWIEVGREADPFKYPYRYDMVHRNELFYDFKAKKADLSDANYLVRRKWYDQNLLKMAFKDKADLIEQIGHGFSSVAEIILNDGGNNTTLSQGFDHESSLTIEEQEWRDVNRRRMVLNEVWYRRWVNGYVIKTPDGRVVEFDKKNKMHMEAVAYQVVEPQPAMFSKLRLSWWIGAHCLADIANPYAHGKFPYVPFWGKREDMTNVPYGMIRAIIPMQDQVNAAETKRIYLLSAKRITMTEGVTVDDEELVRQEAGRPDAMHILSPSAIQAGGMFKVETDFGLSEQQYKSMVDKRQAIKNVAGVYAAFEGNAPNLSGVAINSLTEQSSQTLAEIYDNFSYGRTLGGELLLGLILEDMGEEQTQVMVKQEYNEPKQVILNMPVVKDGLQTLQNDIQRARLKVALSDVPSTSSYRAQRLQMLTQITQSLPPELQALILKFVMSATDLPERKEIVKAINKFNGEAVNEPPKTPEEAQAMQAQAQAAQQQQAMQQKAVELELAAKQAAVEKMQAETQKLIHDLTPVPTTEPVDNSLQLLEAKQAELQSVADKELALARIKAEADIHIAEVNAKSDVSQHALEAQIEKMQWMMQEMAKDIQDDKAEDAKEKAREEKERASKDSEREKTKPEKKEEAPPINIVVGTPQPVARTGTIKPDGKGGFIVTSTDATPPKSKE